MEKKKLRKVLLFSFISLLIIGLSFIVIAKEPEIIYKNINNIIGGIISFVSFDEENNNPIGYEYLDDAGDIVPYIDATTVHIWNTQDNYFFDKDSGIQLTNHFDEYWTHNTFCAGYKQVYNDSSFQWIYDCNDALPFTWSIDSDDETYVNITGWRDKTIGSKEVRIALRYHLKLNDKSLSVQLSIENIGEEDITNDIGFAWKIDDIQIDKNKENDWIKIDGEHYKLNESLDLTFTDLTESYFVMYDYNSGQFLKLDWNENLNYRLDVKSKAGQYNAPVTLGINAGTLEIGQIKTTTLYWIDALEVLYAEEVTYDGGAINLVIDAYGEANGAYATFYDMDDGELITAVIEDSLIGAGEIGTVTFSFLLSVSSWSNDDMNVFYSPNAGSNYYEIASNVNLDESPVWYGNYTASEVDTWGEIDDMRIQLRGDNVQNSDNEEWHIDAFHVYIDYTANIFVEWNETDYDFGSSTNNQTHNILITAGDSNTDVTVDCTGDCDAITHNFTTKSMTDAQTEEVLITCNNFSTGTFSATFNVTSVEDTSSNLFVATCEVITYGTLNVEILKPDDDSSWFENDLNLTVNATVTCSGGSCGIVSALARYNNTASPDNAISTIADTTPFYILGADSWWNGDWSKKVPIDVSLASGTTETNYTVLLNISYNSDMNSDFSDLRFINGSDDTELDYWIEDKSDNTYADIWVEIDNAITTSNYTIYMYYGNAEGTTKSNRSNAFVFYDDFSVDRVNEIYHCYISASGVCNVANGYIEIDSLASYQSAVLWYNLSTFSGDLEITYDIWGSERLTYGWFGTQMGSVPDTGGALDMALNIKLESGDHSIFSQTITTSNRIDTTEGAKKVIKNNWYNESADNTTGTLFIDGVQEGEQKNSSKAPDTYYIGFHARDSEVFIDNLQLRKYTFPEPISYIDSNEITNGANPQSKTLLEDEFFTFNWTLGIASSTPEAYLIDVFFNSSYGDELISNSNTADKQIFLNVGGTPSEDTCTYTSGNWVVDCSDDCVISSPVNLLGNDISITGTGTFTTSADITNFVDLLIEGTDSSNKCIVTCEGGCFKT